MLNTPPDIDGMQATFAQRRKRNDPMFLPRQESDEKRALLSY